ncbi:response regulator [Cohnella endophytica]|uniref:Response regulator n=1 Tax=Cohnella endophytica TaxID=2419778 RepID=A0A494XV59_9BACL|nr:response regulator [Cohnella endophytica]RKP54448.1 response regulator [Cohnella endophytica]
MNKVMLIEDETPILRMVKDMIESSPQGFVVSHTAFNGRKALKLIEESAEKPDLIVTDIRMPVMDGLQLLKELEFRGYDIPCIVLSGYSDFNYAREALQSRAYDYLLKPLKEEHLEQALARASGMLRKRKEASERAYLKKALRLPDDSGAESVNPGYSCYQLLLVRAGTHRSDEWEELSPASGGWRQDEEDLLRTALCTSGNVTPAWWIGGLTSNEKVAVRGLAEPETEALRRDSAEEMFAEWRRSEGMANRQFCLAVSEPVALDRMASSLRALREALARVTRIGESRVWIHGDPDRSAFVLTAELEQACRTIAKSVDYRSFEKAMIGWKEEWRREGYGQLAIESLLAAVVRLFRSQRTMEGAPTVSAFDANELVSACGTLNEVMEQFCGFMKEEYEHASRSRPDRSAKDLIDNVRRYLDERYMESIGSDKLQQVFGYNKTYISNVFSEVVGVPPGKYLAKLRIDKAIALINDRSELSLRQVAEQVGYEDSLYFSKVFKNATGLSPKEYKERRERDATSGST